LGIVVHAPPPQRMAHVDSSMKVSKDLLPEPACGRP
jgi:hypothetical protein